MLYLPLRPASLAQRLATPAARSITCRVAGATYLPLYADAACHAAVAYVCDSPTPHTALCRVLVLMGALTRSRDRDRDNARGHHWFARGSRLPLI